MGVLRALDQRITEDVEPFQALLLKRIKAGR
jgi:hypothetical protein